MPRPGRGAPVARLGNQIRGLAARQQGGLDRADEGQRHRRLRRRDAVPQLARDVGDGMVSAGSNMGHDGGESATWTLGHPEKVKDWGLRAHYSVATAAKTLAHGLFRQAGAALVLRGLLERRPPGDDDGAELSRAVRRDRRGRAVAVVPGPADVAAVDRQDADADGPSGRRRSPPTSARRSRSARCRPATPTTASSTGRSRTRARATSTSTRWARRATARSPPTR